jgi:hypothetical protein
MKLLSNGLSLLLASIAFGVRCASAATSDPLPTLDPAFSAGLSTLKQAAGFNENLRSSTDWRPNLQLLVGVQAVEGSKRTLYFVQLTTLEPPAPTNSAPWQPTLRTNDWALSSSNKAQFVTTLYPVRVRVFDATGRQLKEGQTPIAWGMLTNGLMELCRLSFEANRHNNETNSPSAPSPSSSPTPQVGEKVPAERLRGNPQDNDERMRAAAGGFLWMIGMLYDLQTVPAVGDIWAKAQCAFRRPGAWTVATTLATGHFSLSIEPRLSEITLVNSATAGQAEPLYRLPVDLKNGKRNLTCVEIIVGPAHGAEMLLAGIRSIRARHPTKPKQEFIAEVLAAGSVRAP